MFSTLVKKVFGSRNDRVLRRLQNVVTQINALEPSMQALSDAALQGKTAEFRLLIQQGATLDSILPAAFAVVREASVRVLGLRHFDVQLIGGMVLHEGKIAEMGTGEGKTLVGTLPIYLNALTGKGVHVITVNDYLATRDANWMEPVYTFLGLSTGIIVHGMDVAAKRAAYGCDVTYGTNNEYGFDYLRDNMAFSMEDKVQRELNFAIVDEVDSILIDEARTPLIISGPAEESSELYIRINMIIPQLIRQAEEKSGEPGDYYADEKTRQVYLTELGHQHVEEIFVKEGLVEAGENLYAASNISLMHHLNACLRSHALYQKDVDYIVRNDEVIIVDEHTGRTMAGRRWSDGLHQAVEAKEGVTVNSENQTLASITFQNYFRLYKKLAGMTGTADTEAYEFQQIYGLEVVVIPSNKPVRRTDQTDQIYLNTKDKFVAIIEDIKACQKRQQPVLVGTASIETSEYLASLLTKENIPHQVLNAKFHEKEAQIIAEAGRPGAVTIATNMAGRGTDIVLGGNLKAEIAALTAPTEEEVAKLRQDWQLHHDQVVKAGGLYVIGSERHEARRIDNQLRGRSGRQGDPGGSRFYLSLQDNLMRIFASDRVAAIMQKLGMKEGETIEHPWVTRAIENAQRKVEGRNFDIRKQLLEFDDVANEQRKVIYEQRNELMAAKDISVMMDVIRQDVINAVINAHMPPDTLEEQWDIAGLERTLESDFGLKLNINEWLKEDESLHEATLYKCITELADKAFADKQAQTTPEVMQQFSKSIMLQTLDTQWKEHLAAMDYLRQGIHLRGYAQKNPKQEYKREAFELFSKMLDSIKYDVASIICNVQIRAEEDVEAVEQQRRRTWTLPMQYEHMTITNATDIASEDSPSEFMEPIYVSPQDSPFNKDGVKVGRNDPCPCGSGKKYKQCHGKLA